jgi:hypothetical protein
VLCCESVDYAQWHARVCFANACAKEFVLLLVYWSVGLRVDDTDFRPMPLHHFVVPVAGQGMYKVRHSIVFLCKLLYMQ